MGHGESGRSSLKTNPSCELSRYGSRVSFFHATGRHNETPSRNTTEDKVGKYVRIFSLTNKGIENGAIVGIKQGTLRMFPVIGDIRVESEIGEKVLFAHLSAFSWPDVQYWEHNKILIPVPVDEKDLEKEETEMAIVVNEDRTIFINKLECVEISDGTFLLFGGVHLTHI